VFQNCLKISKLTKLIKFYDQHLRLANQGLEFGSIYWHYETVHFERVTFSIGLSHFIFFFYSNYTLNTSLAFRKAHKFTQKMIGWRKKDFQSWLFYFALFSLAGLKLYYFFWTKQNWVLSDFKSKDGKSKNLNCNSHITHPSLSLFWLIFGQFNLN